MKYHGNVDYIPKRDASAWFQKCLSNVNFKPIIPTEEIRGLELIRDGDMSVNLVEILPCCL